MSKISKSSLKSLFLMGALITTGCFDSSALTPPPSPKRPSLDGGIDSAIPGFPDTGLGGGLAITRLVPGHGPFVGGNSAIVRGSGFTEEAVVSVGGRLVQPADTELLDANRLAIVLPAGEPGFADVQVQVGDEEATLPDGYFYDSVHITPRRGATAGGTFITLIGVEGSFSEGDRVTFGDLECVDVDVVSSSRLTCRNPPGAVGFVDVSVIPTEGTPLTIEDGFEYYDSSDPFNGGLGGGPIDGTINVTVINAMTGTPVDAAFTIMGEDLSTEHQGLTNLMGQIAFSGPDVMAPATIHVAKHCFEKTSFVAFDARDVTIFLVPWLVPECGDPGGGGPPPAGRNGSYVSGELVFLGPNELGPNPWDIIPPGRDGWEKVAYVYGTQPCPLDQRACTNPDPGIGGGRSRILETPVGERGYPYRIFVRPAGQAVYALAGLENRRTGEFLPYVMGVARGVLAGPGEEVVGINILMNIPLDHYLDVRLDGVPGPGRQGPDRFITNADVDLGGEGVIVRKIANARMDIVRQRNPERIRFVSQPALLGELEDGRFRVQASWVTGDLEGFPTANAVRVGIRKVDEEVVVDGFVGIPIATSPQHGARFPTDRMLRWETDGGETPDFHYIIMIGADGNPAWKMFVPGELQEAPIPNLETVPGINDLPSGQVVWGIFAIRMPSFDFDRVSYAVLNELLWEAWSIDVFTAQR